MLVKFCKKTLFVSAAAFVCISLAIAVIVALPAISSASPRNQRYEQSRNYYRDYIGTWIQKVNDTPIARKEIYARGRSLYIRYLWLASGFVGGEYGKITQNRDGSLSFTENYGTHRTRHDIKLIGRNRIQGTQHGQSNKISEYVMVKEESLPSHDRYLDYIGTWIQKVNDIPIARKEIYSRGRSLHIRYLWLASGLSGGEYSEITQNRDGSLTFTENYGTHVSRHDIRLVKNNTIQGSQYGRTGLVSEYVMIKE